MPDRDAATIKDLIYYQYATIIAKSAFAASDGERRLKHRATRSIMTPSRRFSPLPLPQLLGHTRHWRPGRGRRNNGAGVRCCHSVRGDDK